MRDFSGIQQALGLRRFLGSSLGTLYMSQDTSGFPRIMVRHFDSDLSPELARPFAEIMQAAQQWIQGHPELARLVAVEQPIETGRDFIARPFHVYHVPIDAYEEWDDPPETPQELSEMRSRFRQAIGQSSNPRDAITEAVLAKNLLEPTGKTYFDEINRRFIVVEPKVTRDDLERWVALADV